MGASLTGAGRRAALKALRIAAGSPGLDRLGLRAGAERLLTHVTREGVRAGRTFARVQRTGAATRQRAARTSGLFDLTPTDEQAMLVEALSAFAADRLRPAAQQADEACAAPEGLGAEASEIGVALLGVPEELGGLTEERSAVTAVLAAEALARHGDMGQAVALLAPAGVAAALARFGDASQQATYLPAFTGDDVAPAALAGGASAPPALAVLEAGALFAPFAPATTARRAGGDWILDGEKALVPLGAGAELLLVAAATGDGPAAFIVEQGFTAEPDPAMGVRAAATARVRLDRVRVPADALLCAGEDYAELID